MNLFPDAIYASSLHGIMSYFFPVRSGDLALPFILKKTSEIDIVKGSQVLIKARLLDISILGFFTLIAAFTSTISLKPVFHFLWISSGFVMLLSYPVVRIMGRQLSSTVSRYSDLISRLCSIDRLKKVELLESFMIWLFIGLSFYCVARAVGLDLSFQEIWLLVTIQLPLQLLPIQGIANTGNHEFGWVAGLVLLGINPKEALDFALTSHTILILYVLALGIPLLLFAKQKQQG